MSTQSADWIVAARVVRRSGFGATGPQVDSALAQGRPADYVEHALAADFSMDPGVVATPMPDMATPERPDKSSEPELKRYREQLGGQREALTHWWLRRMASAHNPINEKLTFVWHNHFATSGSKVGIPAYMAQQNESIRTHCLGDFRDLAYAMLTGAAMISWLDGQQNKKDSPNENLAREFLELFALGHGNGYTENDIREAARALTGWRIAQNGDTKLAPKYHDSSEKTILGSRGSLGASEFCDLVLAKPASSHYICAQLWQQLASDNPPPRDVRNELTRAYGANRDLRALTLAVLTDEHFLASNHTVVTNPVEWLIGAVRALGTPVDDHKNVRMVEVALKALGQLPFYPPDVGGWPRGRAWLSSATANIRVRVAEQLVRNADVSGVSDSPAGDRLDATGYLLGIGQWSDRTVSALRPLRKNPAELVAAALNTPEYLTS